MGIECWVRVTAEEGDNDGAPEQIRSTEIVGVENADPTDEAGMLNPGVSPGFGIIFTLRDGSRRRWAGTSTNQYQQLAIALDLFNLR